MGRPVGFLLNRAIHVTSTKTASKLLAPIASPYWTITRGLCSSL
jgi:hypothetical protein